MIVSFGTKPASASRVRADQQVADEQRVPGIFGDDARRQRVCRVGAADQILHEQIACRRHGPGSRRSSASKCAGRHRLVVVPPDACVGRWRRARRTCPSASGRCAGRSRRRARRRAVSVASPRADRLLVERRRRKIVVHRARGAQADLSIPHVRIAYSGVRHGEPRLSLPLRCQQRQALPRRTDRENQKSQVISNH